MAQLPKTDSARHVDVATEEAASPHAAPQGLTRSGVRFLEHAVDTRHRHGFRHCRCNGLFRTLLFGRACMAPQRHDPDVDVFEILWRRHIRDTIARPVPVVSSGGGPARSRSGHSSDCNPARWALGDCPTIGASALVCWFRMKGEIRRAGANEPCKRPELMFTSN